MHTFPYSVTDIYTSAIKTKCVKIEISETYVVNIPNLMLFFVLQS